MSAKPQGRYRSEGESGQPNTAFVEIGTIGLDITEQEYRDKGYEPDFDELPWKIQYCVVQKDEHSQKR